jgi:hypothetical protein
MSRRALRAIPSVRPPGWGAASACGDLIPARGLRAGTNPLSPAARSVSKVISKLGLRTKQPRRSGSAPLAKERREEALQGHELGEGIGGMTRQGGSGGAEERKRWPAARLGCQSRGGGVAAEETEDRRLRR